MDKQPPKLCSASMMVLVFDVVHFGCFDFENYMCERDTYKERAFFIHKKKMKEKKTIDLLK